MSGNHWNSPEGTEVLAKLTQSWSERKMIPPMVTALEPIFASTCFILISHLRSISIKALVGFDAVVPPFTSKALSIFPKFCNKGPIEPLSVELTCQWKTFNYDAHALATFCKSFWLIEEELIVSNSILATTSFTAFLWIWRAMESWRTSFCVALSAS